jgi:hypothetical protein
MIMTISLKGEKCRLKARNVFSNPSLTMVAHCITYKISLFKSLSSLELSLLSPKIGGGFDANNSI